MIESMKKQHEEEIKLLDESYKYSLSFLVYKVPFSFSSWIWTREHRISYLLKNLVTQTNFLFRKRVELLEETNSKREDRLKEGNRLLSEQNMATLKMVEQEKSDLVAAHIKRQEEWQNEKQTEVDHLKEIHR